MNKKLTKGSLRSAVIAFGFFLIAATTNAQAIKGVVLNTQGEPLPFAAIFIVNTERGIASNIQGQYSLSLAPARYRVKIQYLGYR